MMMSILAHSLKKSFRAQAGLNHRPIDLQSIALPLSYAPYRVVKSAEICNIICLFPANAAAYESQNDDQQNNFLGAILSNYAQNHNRTTVTEAQIYYH